MNIFCGENAQGKTNLIEALWLCTGCKSFRGAKEKDIVGFGKDISEVAVKFENSQRIQEIIMRNSRKGRFISLNGVKLPSLANLFGNLNAVVFTPEDLELSKGSPDCRRNYINVGIAQLKSRYRLAVVNYNRSLMHRNSVIKRLRENVRDNGELDVWNMQLAKYGTLITNERIQYVKEIAPIAAELYDKISSGREDLSLSYQSGIFRRDEQPENAEDMQQAMKIYLEHLEDNKPNDIRSGITQAGIHRDDIITKINGLNSREFGSQGQSRSIALVMKLAQAELFRQKTGECPIVLLDDVLSELDPSRQEFILQKLGGFQVFVTCCDIASAKRFGDGKLFTVDNGTVKEAENVSSSG